MIGGNPADFRDAARRVRTHGDEVTRSAEAVLRGSGPRWHSTAGSTYQDVLEETLRTAARAAQVVDAYAAALDQLADGLEQRQQVVSSLLDQAGATWDDARRIAAEGAGDLVDGIRKLLP
jgi:ABC-type transporter Mla subunit MlaD